ncbi:MAG: CARDB domain-containing protein [Halolamina sp.]
MPNISDAEIGTAYAAVREGADVARPTANAVAPRGLAWFGLCSLLVAVVVVGAVGAAGTPALTASSNASVVADPNGPGQVSTHTVTAVVGSASANDSLNGLLVDYSVGAAPADVSNVGQNDVVRVGIDTDGDGTIDTDISDDFGEVSVSNDGETIMFGFGGSYSLSKGDRIVVEFADARNPDAEGSYDVGVVINPQSTGGAYTATLDVKSDTGGTGGDTGDGSDGGSNETTDDTTTETGDRTANETTTDPAPLRADIAASPATAGNVTTHRLRVEVGGENDGESLSGLVVDYDDSDVSEVELSELGVGVDRDGDGTVDASLTGRLDAVRVTTTGRLRLVFDGVHRLSGDDVLVVTVRDVRNPEAGKHHVGVEVNPGRSDVATTATLRVAGSTPEPSDGVVSDGFMTVSPPVAYETAVYAAHATLTKAVAVRQMTVRFPEAVDVGRVGLNDLAWVGVDTDGDGRLDVDLAPAVENVTVRDGAVTVSLSDARTVGPDETVVVGVKDIGNPGIGQYVGAVRVNDRQAQPVTASVGAAEEPVASVTTDNGTQALVEQPPAGETVAIGFGAVRDGGVALERLSVRFQPDGSELFVGSGGQRHSPVDARGESLGQLTLRHAGTDASRVVVEFTVERARLNRTAFGPSNVSLYYRADGGWQRAETWLVNGTGSTYRFRAAAKTVSTYAVRAEPPNPRQRPALGVERLAVNESTPALGDSVEFTARVRNTGPIAGQREFSVTVNGVVLVERTVSLAPNESVTFRYNYTFSRGGSYEVAVGNESVAVDVRGDGSAGEPPTSSSSGPGFGAVTATVAVAAAGVVLARRRHGTEGDR